MHKPLAYGVGMKTNYKNERQVKYFRALTLWLANCQNKLTVPRRYSARYRAYINLSKMIGGGI
jgi:hypothetical protein